MLFTGHADLQTAMNAINRGNVFRLMTKPCAPEILADALTQGIEQYLRNSNAPGAFDREDFTGRSKRILVVDDDPGIRELLTDVMTATCDGLEVVTAENGRKAAGMLGSARVDLVLTDLRMPDVNGLKLLAYMRKYYSGIPAIVMTGVGTPEIENKIEKCKNYRYFEKPLDISLLMDVIVRELASRPLIQIHGISISALLQLIDAEKKTCTLKVMSGERTGYLYFAKGTLIAAETARLNAEEAACAIINWDRTVMEIDHFCPRKTREIHQPLMRVLMESARLKDEMAERTNS